MRARAPAHTAANAGQENADANFIDQSPPHFVDDHTWINSDGAGNACDEDDDNDGLTDASEASGSSCEGIVTDPLLPDAEGILVVDGADCAMGFDPTVGSQQAVAGAMRRASRRACFGVVTACAISWSSAGTTATA